MAEILLTRKSGLSSSLSSKRLPWHYSGYRLFGRYLILIIATSLITITSIGLLMINDNQRSMSLEQYDRQIQSVNALVQQIWNVRLQSDWYLSTHQADDLKQSQIALAELPIDFDQVLTNNSAITQFDLEKIKDRVVAYTNTFRSLSELVSYNAAPDTQQQILTQLHANGQALDQQTAAFLGQTISGIQLVEERMDRQSSQFHAIVLGVIAFTFLIGLAIMLRQTYRIVHDLALIGEAAQEIASGCFETRVALNRTDEIGQLGIAFNAMADSLKRSRRTETSASEQNRKQLLKLAREERRNAILEERQRIARELHDSVKQQLFSITLAAGAAYNLIYHSPQLAQTYLEHVQQAGQYALSEMTALLQELIPVPLQEQRLEDALSQYLHWLCETHGIMLVWRVEGTNTLSLVQEHALFRVVQESASNVVRHSKATMLRVAVNFGLQTQIIVEDNGQGFDPAVVQPQSTGLATIRLRLKRVGGSYKLTSSPGSGTRLTITVDLRKKVIYEQP